MKTKQARFPEGKSVDVPEYLREHGNPEAADEWEKMNEEYGDMLKKAMEHPTKEDYYKYMQEHPNADRRKHTIKPPEHKPHSSDESHVSTGLTPDKAIKLFGIDEKVTKSLKTFLDSSEGKKIQEELLKKNPTPEGFDKGNWGASLVAAAAEREWAESKDQKYLDRVSDMTKEWVFEATHSTTKERAKKHYEYLRHRASLKDSSGYPIDRIASEQWEAFSTEKPSKKATGEGTDPEWMEALKKDMKTLASRSGGLVRLLGVRAFDQYQGPYADIQVKNLGTFEVWTDDEGFYIPDFPIVNTSSSERDGYKARGLADLIETIKKAVKESRSKKTAEDSLYSNPTLIRAIRAGDRVTILDRFGQEHTGTAVMVTGDRRGWVLNMGGPHGTPGIATEDNVTKVKKGKKPMPSFGPSRVIAADPAVKTATQELLPKSISSKIPKLYSQEKVADPIVWVKFFNPYGRGTWLITEFDGRDTMFGLADLGSPELGYVSLSELSSLTKFGAPMIERDLHFRPMPLSEAIKKEHINYRVASSSKELKAMLKSAMSELEKMAYDFDSDPDAPVQQMQSRFEKIHGFYWGLYWMEPGEEGPDASQYRDIERSYKILKGILQDPMLKDLVKYYIRTYDHLEGAYTRANLPPTGVVIRQKTVVDVNPLKVAGWVNEGTMMGRVVWKHPDSDTTIMTSPLERSVVFSPASARIIKQPTDTMDFSRFASEDESTSDLDAMLADYEEEGTNTDGDDRHPELDEGSLIPGIQERLAANPFLRKGWTPKHEKLVRDWARDNHYEVEADRLSRLPGALSVKLERAGVYENMYSDALVFLKDLLIGYEEERESEEDVTRKKIRGIVDAWMKENPEYRSWLVEYELPEDLENRLYAEFKGARIKLLWLTFTKDIQAYLRGNKSRLASDTKLKDIAKIAGIGREIDQMPDAFWNQTVKDVAKNTAMNTPQANWDLGTVKLFLNMAMGAWKKNNKKADHMAALETLAGLNPSDDKLSRFEEGVSADPTENMSPEDKAKWDKQKEEHKDDFKKEAKESEKTLGKKGPLGYIAFYKGRQVDVYADSQIKAREMAAAYFKAKKEWEVDVWLAEKNGKPVVHTPTFASAKSASHIVFAEDEHGETFAFEMPPMEALMHMASVEKTAFNQTDEDFVEWAINQSPMNKAQTISALKRAGVEDILPPKEKPQGPRFQVGDEVLISASKHTNPATADIYKEYDKKLGTVVATDSNGATVQFKSGTPVHFPDAQSRKGVGIYKWIKPFDMQGSKKLEIIYEAGKPAKADRIVVVEQYLSRGKSEPRKVPYFTGHVFTARFNKSGGIYFTVLPQQRLHVDPRGQSTEAGFDATSINPEVGTLYYLGIFGKRPQGWETELESLRQNARVASSEIPGEDNKLSRFEEGKPADPTQNMSPEDAKKWDEQKEEHRDEFTKKARFNFKPGDKLKVTPVPPALRKSYPASKIDSPMEVTVQEDGGTEGLDVYDVTLPDGKEDSVYGFQIVGRGKKAYTSYKGDPFWMKAKYPGKAEDGTPFKKGEDILYWPRTKTIMVGRKAEQEWREFQAHAEDEDTYMSQYHRAVDEEKTAGILPPLRLTPIQKAANFLRDIFYSRDGIVASNDLEVIVRRFGEIYGKANLAKALKMLITEGLVIQEGTDWTMPVMLDVLRTATGKANHLAAQSPTGLYGYTRKVQADCETAAKKLSKHANAVAKRIYAKDEKVAEFLATHAKRGKSLPAQVLVASLQNMGPKFASEDTKESAGEGKTASNRTYGLYGFGSKTANLGITACAEIREQAGIIASDLHHRRADAHEHITGFLAQHAKEGKCAYSKLLHASYPDASMRLASVTDWLAWEE